MNGQIEKGLVHPNAQFNPESGFGHGHAKMDAFATIKSGTLAKEYGRNALGGLEISTQTKAALLGAQAGEQFRDVIMQRAAEKDEADQMMMEARAAIEQYVKEMTAFEGSISGGELMAANQVQTGLDHAVNANVDDSPVVDVLMAGGLASVFVVDMIGKIADKLPPKARPYVAALVLLAVGWACSGQVPPFINTAVANDPRLTEVGAQGNPTETKAAPTKTPEKPKTSTPSKTPEATPVSKKLEVLSEIPPEMVDVYELLNTQELDGKTMKVVLLESSTKYGEIEWKGKIINAWTEVLFTLNGKPVKGIIVHQWYDIDDKYRYKIETSGITIAPSPPNPNGVKVGTEALYADTPSDNPIVTLEFGSTGNDLTDKVFEGAMPLEGYTGKDSELVNIPGIGWVLPVTHMDITEALGASQ